MLIFKCGVVVLSSTYILSVFSQLTQQTNSLVTGLAFLYIASWAIGFMSWPYCKFLNSEEQKEFKKDASKIVYDRYQQIRILGSLTPNPNVTSLANKIASISASILSVGFLVYLLMFLFKVDSHSLMALSIFICGFCTSYIWMQSIITTYVSTLYYDQQLSMLRQCLANVSFLILIIMAVFGVATSLLPRSGVNNVYICLLVTYLCSYLLAAILCIFIITFEREYQYFSEGLRSDMLLDDACSLGESMSGSENIFGTQETISQNASMVKKGLLCSIKNS